MTFTLGLYLGFCIGIVVMAVAMLWGWIKT